jgi:hypothetical protein
MRFGDPVGGNTVSGRTLAPLRLRNTGLEAATEARGAGSDAPLHCGKWGSAFLATTTDFLGHSHLFQDCPRWPSTALSELKACAYW